jgi:flagellar hook-associated protein 1
MSLFTTLQLAKNALNVAQIGLQVTGNNMANANTPSYLRQELLQTPAPSHRRGDLLLGLGVQVEKIEQQVDRFLQERLRGATSDLSSSEAQEKVYLQLESVLAELSESDLSTAMTDFFNAVNDVLNQPGSRSIRNLVGLQGEVLSRGITSLDARVRELRTDVNRRVFAMAESINARLEEVAKLNVRIVTTEGGGARKSDAVGLRDQRAAALQALSKLIDIQTVEQPTGSISVFAGGEFLVFEGTFRGMTTELEFDRGLSIANIKLAATDAPIISSSGELAGLVEARDAVLGGFLDKLDSFAKALIFEFNKVYSRGQGLKGYSNLTSEFAVDDAKLALDQTGLPFTAQNGAFQLLVRNTQTSLGSTTNIKVELNGLDSDTTLESLAAALNAVDGVKAEITPTRLLRLQSESPSIEFAFANDSSGILAALGHFFSGSGATNIGVSRVVRDEPAVFAASRGGVGEDTENAIALAALLDAPLEALNGDSLSLIYRNTVAEITQGSSAARAVAEGFRVFHQTLEGEHMSISGVNLDEEAVKMIAYQRAFQMSARLIVTVSEVLETLVSL